MSDNRNQQANAKKNGNGNNGRNFNGNGNGNTNFNGDTEKKETPKERKMRLINQDNFWNVIKNKTPDTAEYVNLLNSNDDLIYRLRMTNFERGSKLTYDDLKEFSQRNNAIKDSINQLNIDLSKALGKEYRPPRGYSAAPAKQQQEQKTQPQAGEKKQKQQANAAVTVTQEMPAANA